MKKERTLTKAERSIRAEKKKKLIRRAGIGACVIGALVLILLVFRVRIISIAGENHLIYRPLFGERMDETTIRELENQLIFTYGKEGVSVERFRGTLDGKKVIVYDTSFYESRYLGRVLSGEDYALCTITTVRSVRESEESEPLLETRRVCTYFGYDNIHLETDITATLDWETLQESYSDSKEAFDDILTTQANG